MKFSYNVVVVSNSRRLDESGDLNSHDGRLFIDNAVSPSTQITPELRHSIFLEVWKMGITFVVVRLFPQRLLLIELLLAPLNFVLA